MIAFSPSAGAADPVQTWPRSPADLLANNTYRITVTTRFTMSGVVREENIRLRITAASELPDVASQLELINQLLKQQMNIMAQSQAIAAAQSKGQIDAIESVTAALKEQQKTTRQNGDDTNALLKKVNAQFDEVGKTVRNFTSLLATAFTVGEIKSFGLDIIDAKTKIDQLKVALDVMLGSKKQSAELYQEIVRVAKETPFSVDELTENVVKLKGFGIETKNLIPDLLALGNMAAAVGKDKLPQMTLALGQVAATGRLMGDELNQFVESGVPMYDLLAASMGKTRAEVVKLAQDHQISFQQIEKAIRDGSEQGGKYYNLMVLQARTVGGEVDRLKDIYRDAKVQIGNFFEDGIKSGTARLNELISATIGSNSAIARTYDIVKSVTAAFVTYQVATNASAVASALLTGYETAKNIIYGTYLLTLRAVTQQQVVYTAAQMEATVAAQGFGAVLAANPIGAVATALGVLVTAYYAYKAVNDEVTTQLGEQEIQLKTEQAELNALTQAAMDATEGTKTRKDAIDLLIKKYPEYFAGLNSEKTSNNQLKSILDAVNNSYEKRIALARQAYQLETISDKEREALKFEKDFFDSLPEEIGIQFGGNIQKFVQALNDGGVAAAKLRKQLDDFAPGGADFFGEVARNAAQRFDETKKSYAALNTSMQKTDKDRITAAVDAENTRWKNQLASLKKGTGDYKVAEQAHLDALAKINGTYRETETKNTAVFADNTKTITVLSAKEQAAAIKGVDQQSIFDKIDYLKAAEKEEIESANRIKVDKNISDAELEKLEEKTRGTIIGIHEKYAAKEAKLRRDTATDILNSVDKQTDAEKQAADAVSSYNAITAGNVKKNQEDIRKAYEHTAKLKSDLAEATATQEAASAMSEKILTAKTVQEKHDLLLEFGKRTNDDLAVQDLVRLKDVKDTLDQEAEVALFIYGKKSTEYQKALDKSLIADKEYAVNSTKVQEQASAVLLQIWQQQEQRRKQLLDQAITGMVQALNTFNQQTQQLRDNSVKGLQDEMQAELDKYTDNYEKRKQIVEQFSARQEEALYSANALSKITNFLSSALTAFQTYTAQKAQIEQDYSTKVQEIEATRQISIANGTSLEVANHKAAEDQKSASSAKTQQEIVAGVSATAQFVGSIIQSNLQLQIQANEVEKQIAKDKHDAQIAYLDDKFQKETVLLDQTTQANLTAAQKQYTDSKSWLEQQLLDKQTQIANDRNKEITDTTNHYADLIKAAEGNNAEQQRLRGELTTKLKEINDKYDNDLLTAKTDNEKAQTTLTGDYNRQRTEISERAKNAQVGLQTQLTAEKARADKDYDDEVRELNRQQFEAQRSMAKASIAVSLVQGAAQLFAINPILGIIGAFAAVGAGAYLFDQLNSIPNPYDGSTSSGGNLGGVNGDGAIAFDSTGKPIYGFDKDGNPQYKNDKGEIVTNTNEPAIKVRWRNLKSQVATDEGLVTQLADLRHELSGANPDGDYYKEVKGKIDLIVGQHPDLEGEIARYKQQIIDLEQSMRNEGIPFFLGSPYVEGLGYPDGRDTVPAMINKGERILTTADNLSIGGRELTNEELVKKVKGYDQLMLDFPKMFMPAQTDLQLRLPSELMHAPLVPQVNIDMSGLIGKLDRMDKTLKTLQQVHINMDERGFSKTIHAQNAKTTYYQTIFNR